MGEAVHLRAVAAAHVGAVARGLEAMKPYYSEKSNGRFKKGEARLKIKTISHRKAISEGQKKAWRTKRQRLPIGTRRLDACGYVLIKVVPGKGRWKAEHVIVMEHLLGRELRNGEVIHHVDGDRQNNAGGNLYLCRGHKHHMEVEKQLKETLRALLRKGRVWFDHSSGRYNLHDSIL